MIKPLEFWKMHMLLISPGC